MSKQNDIEIKKAETKEIFGSVFTCKCDLNSHRLNPCGYDCQVIFNNTVTMNMMTTSEIYNNRITYIPPLQYLTKNK